MVTTRLITVLLGSMLSAGSAAAETSGGRPAEPPAPCFRHADVVTTGCPALCAVPESAEAWESQHIRRPPFAGGDSRHCAKEQQRRSGLRVAQRSAGPNSDRGIAPDRRAGAFDDYDVLEHSRLSSVQPDGGQS
jgi:hypothetical protein